MNSRKKRVIILDVETNHKQEVFDISIIVGDLHGKILVAKQWIIEEIYPERLFWEEKRPDYEKVMADPTHPAKLVKAKEAFNELKQIITDYKVKIIYAYNASFDTRTLNNLANDLNLENPIKDIEIDCLWFWSAQTIFQQKTFFKWANKYPEHTMTNKGNYKTSAEIAYAYLTREPTFQEVHRGLEDCLIEYQIFLACRKQRKIRAKGICFNAWILVQPQEQINKLPKQFRSMKMNLQSQIEQTTKVVNKFNKQLQVQVEAV